MNRWVGWTVGLVALALSSSAGLACDRHEKAADVKDAKAIAANGETKDCDMPCCAHAKGEVDAKAVADAAAEKPCAAHEAKGCPKKTTATAAAVKAEAAKDTAKAAPVADPGTNR